MTKIGIPEIRKKKFITPQPQICYSEAMFIFNIFFFACLLVGCVRPFCKLGNWRKKIDQRQKCSQLKASMDGQMLLTQIFFFLVLLSQLLTRTDLRMASLCTAINKKLVTFLFWIPTKANYVSKWSEQFLSNFKENNGNDMAAHGFWAVFLFLPTTEPNQPVS